MSSTAAALPLACAAALVLLGGCDSPPETVVDSDVPQIVGLENRHASGIEHDGATLVGGRFLYRGHMSDPLDVARDTTSRYRSHGWAVESQRIFPTSAVLLFTKDEREVQVDLKCSMLNPAMGAGSIDVHRRGGAAAPRSRPASRDESAPTPQPEGGGTVVEPADESTGAAPAGGIS